MPQALIPILAGVLGGSLLATVAATLVLTLGISFLSGLLFGKGAKSQRPERSIKNPTPERNRAFGQRRLHGAWMLFDTASNGYTVDVWAFHDGRAAAITQAYLNDEPITVSGGYVDTFPDGAYLHGNIGIGWNLGLATETAFAAIIALVPSIWTSGHRGDGIVSAYLTKKPVKAKNFVKRYPQGDNVNLSLAGQWRLCFDPREVGHDPDDPDTWEWTENPALHLLTYFMTDREFVYAVRLEPVIDYWIDAADDCDTAQALDVGGSEARYRGCVAYELTARPGEVVNEILACFDGWTAQDQDGCQIVYSGRVYTPTVSIGPDQIVGYSHQSFVEDENHVNELIVQYVAAENKFDTVEAQAWRDEADISERGRVNSDGFSPQVPSPTQARRLARRAMLRRNAPNRGTVTTNFSGRSIIGQRFVNLTIEEAGATFFDGVAEIVGAERDYDTGGVTFEWVEAVDGVDDWTPATDDGEGANPGERVPVEVLETPVITAAAFFGTDNSGGGQAGARIRLTVEAPDRDDLTWFVRWRREGTDEWSSEQEYGDVDPGASVTIETGFIPADDAIEVEVAYTVGDGRISEWSAPVTVDTSAATTFDSTIGTFDSTTFTFDRG